MEIPTSVPAYNGKPYMRYCAQWTSLYPFLRAIEIPISAMMLKDMRYCVQLDRLRNLWRTTGFLAEIHIPNADSGPPAAGKISNPKSICIGVGAVVVVATRETRLCRQ